MKNVTGLIAETVLLERPARRGHGHDRIIYESARARIDRVADGIAEARTNFFAVRIMHNGDSQLFATGRYLDRIDVSATPFRFIERTVVLDSQKIDTLLVIPL